MGKIIKIAFVEPYFRKGGVVEMNDEPLFLFFNNKVRDTCLNKALLPFNGVWFQGFNQSDFFLNL